MRRIRAVTAILLVLVLGQALYVAPAAAQDDAYQAALESGKLALLIPQQFADADMGLDFGGSFILPPSGSNPDAEAARVELVATMESAGTTADDVVSITGRIDGDPFTTFTATLVPAIAPVDWFELVYRAFRFRNFSDPVREVVAVGPKQVLRITEQDRDVTRTFYAQGEILWEFFGDEVTITGFLEGLATIDGPALSADPEAAADG